MERTVQHLISPWGVQDHSFLSFPSVCFPRMRVIAQTYTSQLPDVVSSGNIAVIMPQNLSVHSAPEAIGEPNQRRYAERFIHSSYGAFEDDLGGRRELSARCLFLLCEDDTYFIDTARSPSLGTSKCTKNSRSTG